MNNKKDIINDFENFINDICGPAGSGDEKYKESIKNKKRWRVEQERYDEFAMMEEFTRVRRELAAIVGDSHKIEHECTCKEKYVIYIEPEYDRGYMPYEDFSRYDPDQTQMTVTRRNDRFYCMSCGNSICTSGQIRYIQNLGAQRNIEIVRPAGHRRPEYEYDYREASYKPVRWK